MELNMEVLILVYWKYSFGDSLYMLNPKNKLS